MVLVCLFCRDDFHIERSRHPTGLSKSGDASHKKRHILPGHIFAMRLVDSMAHGQEVSLRLGPKQSRFRLNGAKAAAEDFRRRVAGQ